MNHHSRKARDTMLDMFFEWVSYCLERHETEVHILICLAGAAAGILLADSIIYVLEEVINWPLLLYKLGRL